MKNDDPNQPIVRDLVIFLPNGRQAVVYYAFSPYSFANLGHSS